MQITSNCIMLSVNNYLKIASFVFFRLGLYYWKWFGVYPRVAVHLCFIALSIANLCRHNSQWILASLFIISAALRAMEVFTLLK